MHCPFWSPRGAGGGGQRPLGTRRPPTDIRRAVPDEKLSRRKVLKRGLALGGLLLAGDAFGIEPEWLQVERIQIPLPGLGPAFDGYRIALLSDFHWPRFVSRAVLDAAIDLALAFDPHLIAVPGDLCDNAPTFDLPSLRGLFDRLQAPDGVVGTLGNHDHKIRDVAALRREIANETPIRILDNAHRVIRRGDARLVLGGVGDLMYGVVDPLAAFAGAPAGVPRLLLSHNPDVAEIWRWPTRVDLQLSGHTHGGEVRLPFGPAPFSGSLFGQKYRAGLVQGPHHRVYVTRGVCSTHHVRFFCRPEVTYLTLRTA